MYIESVPNRNSPPAILLRESFRDVAVPPLSSVRSPSTSSAGQSDRLAMVRFLILAPF
jgi:ABC-type microcin C transport system duplicated ATPase subunit YejF